MKRMTSWMNRGLLRVSGMNKSGLSMISLLRVMTLLGKYWRGDWQYDISEHCMDNDYAVVQGARQSTGKSWILSLISCVYILAGYRVIIGMPVMEQSTRILLRNINNNMLKLEQILPIQRMKPDNIKEILWDNGGSVIALSVNKASQKEGYTGELLIIDEGHRAQKDILSIFKPFVDIAFVDGCGKIIITGVGGYKESLIESMKEENGGLFKSIMVTDEMILETHPEYRQIFDDAKKVLSESGYDQMYRCKPVQGDARYCFQTVPERLEFPREYQNLVPALYFGCDVGRENDPTVVTVLEIVGDYISVKDSLEIKKTSFNQQATDIFRFINKYFYIPGHIIVEKNGLGHGLCDALELHIPGIKRVNLSYNLKEALMHQLSKKIEACQFAAGSKNIKARLEAVMVSVGSTGNLSWSHDDYLSSILMGLCGQSEVWGILPIGGVS